MMTHGEEPGRKKNQQVILIVFGVLCGAITMGLVFGFDIDRGNDFNASDDDDGVANEQEQRCVGERLDTIERYLRLTGFIDVDDLTDAEWEDELTSLLWVNASQSVAETGTWSPRDAFIEYQYAGLPQYNENSFQFLQREIVDETIQVQTKMEPVLEGSDDELMSAETIRFTSNDTVILQGNVVPSLAIHEFYFPPQEATECDTTIYRHYLELPDALVSGIRFNAERVDNERIDFLCGQVMEQGCQDQEMPPYDTLEDCIWFWQSIPTGCNSEQGIMVGNTTQCRGLHIINSRINPDVHCKHTSPGSDGKCAQSDCDEYFWPAYENVTSGLFLPVETVEELSWNGQLVDLLRSGTLLRYPHIQYTTLPNEDEDAAAATNEGDDASCLDDFTIISEDPALEAMLLLGSTCGEMVTALQGFGSVTCQTTTFLEGLGFNVEAQNIIQGACPSACGLCPS